MILAQCCVVNTCCKETIKRPVKTTGSEQLLSNRNIKARFIKTLYRDPSPSEQQELDEILNKLTDK